MKVLTLEQLVEDLKEAKTAAVAAHDATVDVGTCNMDCVFLEVPKTQHKLVKEALSVASVQGSQLPTTERTAKLFDEVCVEMGIPVEPTRM